MEHPAFSIRLKFLDFKSQALHLFTCYRIGKRPALQVLPNNYIEFLHQILNIPKFPTRTYEYSPKNLIINKVELEGKKIPGFDIHLYIELKHP